MDAHYTKVMAAREAIKEVGTRYYFAYSGILDRPAFEQWRKQHSYEFFNLPAGAVGVAQNVDLIFDFNSRWWGGRVAGLKEKSGATVYGLLFEIPKKEWPIVQHKEGVISGACIERTVNVQVGDKKIEATAFTTAPERVTLSGPISEDYVEALERGAKNSGLPEEYVKSIRERAARA